MSLFFLYLIITIFILYFIYYVIISKYKYYKYFSDKQVLSISELQKEDLLFRSTKYFGFIIPGYFFHAGIFAGYDKDNNLYLIDSLIFKGVRRIKLDKFLRKGGVAVCRINKFKKEDADKLIDWCESKMYSKFSHNVFKKDKAAKKFYCSGFVWAAFVQLNVNLDFGKYLEFIVTPQKIYNSNLVEHLGILKGI